MLGHIRFLAPAIALLLASQALAQSQDANSNKGVTKTDIGEVWANCYSFGTQAECDFKPKTQGRYLAVVMAPECISSGYLSPAGTLDNNWPLRIIEGFGNGCEIGSIPYCLTKKKWKIRINVSNTSQRYRVRMRAVDDPQAGLKHCQNVNWNRG